MTACGERGQMVRGDRTQTATKAAIALGSNLGDSRHIMDSALAILAQQQGITLEAASSWYWTAAVGPPQPDYLNRCATLHIEISPEAMLDTLLAVEQQFGRVRRERWGPRTLDLDLLLVGDRILETPKLQLPHPRMRERAFVLVPLAEIAPDWVDPVSREEIYQLLRRVDTSGVRRIG